MEDSDPFAQAVARLSDEGLALEISDRTFRLVDAVRGDAGAAALRLLGMVQAAAPVAIATHGATQVAVAVWVPPRLFVARWGRNRWVVGYRLAAGSRPNDYVRTEGRIPGHLETGNWYESVPDDVAEAFAGVGLTLASIGLGSAVVFFVGATLAGVGFGAGFQGAIRMVVPLAGPRERAGVLSALYVVCYLAMGVPAVFGGLRVVYGHGLLAAAREYGIAVMVLAALALAGSAVGDTASERR